MGRLIVRLTFGLLLATALVACDSNSLDDELREIIAEQRLEPISGVVAPTPELFELGEALFFDNILSGNRDISCATCHHPLAASGDGLSLPVGTKGVGLTTNRTLGWDRDLIPRNAPDLFNRGASGWFTMFWDSRVAGTPEDGFTTPAGNDLPEGLDSVLAAQAMFPPTSPAEMLGRPGDVAATGHINEVASETSIDAIWDTLTNRVLTIPEYRTMFAGAFPDLAVEDIGFEHIANAISAYEAAAFSFVDSAWDRYLTGDSSALNEDAKRGAVLFYGKAGCGGCHTGPLLTDQLIHSVAPPQVGPGRGEEAPDDWGRESVSRNFADRYGFRTPPLRNVELTGPWFHDGAYVALEMAIRHFLDPATALSLYDPSLLRADVSEFYIVDEARSEQAIELLDPRLVVPKSLTDEQIANLEQFLLALTDPAARDLAHMVPSSVPSGIPVDGN